MEVIYTLIPAMILLGLIMVGVLIWAVRKGQYEDFEGDGNRILMDDDDNMMPDAEDRNAEKNQRNWPDAD